MINFKKKKASRSLTSIEIDLLHNAGRDSIGDITDAYDIAYSLIEDVVNDSILHAEAASRVYQGMKQAFR